MGHCHYFKVGACTNHAACTWQGKGTCRKNGVLEADRLTSREPVLEQLGIHKIRGHWVVGNKE